MSSNITFAYGNYSFAPRPLITIAKTPEKTDAGSGLGSSYILNLIGTIVSTGGYSMNQVFSQIEDLRNAFDNDGKLLLLQCSGTTPVISGRPKILNLNIEDGVRDQFTYTAGYTISLEMESLTTSTDTVNNVTPPPYIRDFTESWNIDFNGGEPFNNGNNDLVPMRINVSHSISAVGKPIYTNGTAEVGSLIKPAWEQARDYLINRLSSNISLVSLSGILNINPTSFATGDYVRAVAIEETNASVNINESFILVETGTNIPGKATESFVVNINKNLEDALTNVSINGTIEGYNVVNYGTSPGDFTISQSKFYNASGYWDNIQSKIYYRANNVFSNMSSGQYVSSLNIIPVVESLGINQLNGTINYNYEYNDRPSNCISGAISETILISDTTPGDLVAQLIVLGRASGPLLQSIGTKTPARQRDININVTVAPSTGCGATNLMAARPTGSVQSLIDGFYSDLSGTYSQVFNTADNDTWNPKTGKYTRNVTWIFSDC